MHNGEQQQLMQSAAEKSLQLLTEFHKNPVQFSTILEQYITLTRDFQNMLQVLFQNPEQLWKMQVDYWTDSMHLMQEHYQAWMQGNPLPIPDKRFGDARWMTSPFFNTLTQHYLLATRHIHTLLEKMEYKDKNAAKRVQFIMNQYLDALSPSNFISTNPELIAETLKSEGVNVLKGLNNLLNDIDPKTAKLNVTMSDKKAFRLGENLATTPGKVIFRNAMMELIQYTPQTAKVYAIPLLIIPPWINKYYILDLGPENSLIHWLVAKGFSVFVISWVNPDASYANKSLHDYLQEGPGAAIKIIKNQLNINKINSLGFCIGGTLQAMLLAYNRAIGDNSIHTATFLATLLDFSDPGDISVFIDEQQISKIEADMKKQGYLAGKVMASSFNALRANDLIWSFFIKNYLQGQNAAPFDILYWNADSTNMPATMHSQYLRWMYLQNDLIKPGVIKLNGVALDISTIDIPVFFLSTNKDHIAPWQATWSGFEKIKGEKRFVLGGSGHIAGIVNPPEAKKYGYYTGESYEEGPEKWFGSTVFHEGSWWPEWGKWLGKYSGKKIAAPKISALPWPGIEDAPGSYVKKT